MCPSAVGVVAGMKQAYRRLWNRGLPSFLTLHQSEDADLCQVQEWFKTSSVPLWDDLRGSSASVKAYYMQLDSLILKDGVIYHRLESLHNQEMLDQLLMPRTLREEFLTLVHSGISGHLRTYKT